MSPRIRFIISSCVRRYRTREKGSGSPYSRTTFVPTTFVSVDIDFAGPFVPTTFAPVEIDFVGTSEDEDVSFLELIDAKEGRPNDNRRVGREVATLGSSRFGKSGPPVPWLASTEGAAGIN